jgi:hypothetical protein
MLRTSVVALALSTGVILSGSALAEPAKFDGTWSVSLVANGGLCGSGTSSTLMVQNGSVRAGGSGVSVSGQVGPGGSVSLALQKNGVQGRASGKLSGSSGSGSWSVSSLGCSGHWTARRA